MARRLLATILLTAAWLGAGQFQPTRAQDPHKAVVAAEQAPAASSPALTEAARRDILKTAEALTKETLADVLRKAEAGDVDAQVLAGIAFQDGRVVPKDNDAAARWIRAAAEKGHPMGQNMLGNLYNRGAGVPQDPAQAVEWFTKAAAQGYAQAQSNLGQAYASGRGVPASPADAARLFRLAAEQGNTDGQVALGYACVTGAGVGKNEREGVEWFRKAAEQGDAMGQFNLALAYERGESVRKDKSEAERWYKKASEQGEAIGSYRYGWLNLEKAPPGRTDPIATRIAVDAFELSAAQGYPVAAFALGDLYTGRIFRYHVTKDELAACTWYAIASSLDRQNDWEPVQTQPVRAMRKELPDRMEKIRQRLGTGPYAACESRAAEWMAALPQQRTP